MPEPEDQELTSEETTYLTLAALVLQGGGKVVLKPHNITQVLSMNMNTEIAPDGDIILSVSPRPEAGA